jgi:hypothetical protein
MPISQSAPQILMVSNEGGSLGLEPNGGKLVHLGAMQFRKSKASANASRPIQSTKEE